MKKTEDSSANKKIESISKDTPDKLQKYNEELFIVVTSHNKKTIIEQFCKALFEYNLSEFGTELQNDLYEYEAELELLLNRFPTPFTIVQEFYHIDKSFRDSYYMYFSNQHFQVKRYSRRLSFFQSELGWNDFFGETAKELESLFMGSCVINPLTTGAIGRTLIYPKYILKTTPVYMRLSEFVLHIYGKKLTVRAFPYRMQDEETMRCGEVTLLNLLEYYSNSYNDYRAVAPSDILNTEQKHNHERVLPARGITYPILTKVLSEFGFSPRLYNLTSIDSFSLSQVTQTDELKRWLHYYIESGIPVALNLMPVGTSGPGHSIVCIGHGQAKRTLFRSAMKKRWISWENRDTCHPIINSADFYEDYTIVDDNQPVYQIKNFAQLSSFPDMRVENIAVPLYKRMFMDAPDAAAIIRSILHHPQYGIDVWAENFLKPKEDVIIRLFMASSHGLKKYRIDTLSHPYAKEAYAIVPMPRFVWVCELYRVNDYCEGLENDNLNAFGEIVIDATSSPSRGHNYRSLILMHYPHVIGVRFPDQPESIFDDMVNLDNDALFPGYKKNLEKIT